jgi:hypothetical protein
MQERHGMGEGLLKLTSKVPITVYTQGHTLPIFWMVLQQTAFGFLLNVSLLGGFWAWLTTA